MNNLAFVWSLYSLTRHKSLFKSSWNPRKKTIRRRTYNKLSFFVKFSPSSSMWREKAGGLTCGQRRRNSCWVGKEQEMSPTINLHFTPRHADPCELAEREKRESIGVCLDLTECFAILCGRETPIDDCKAWKLHFFRSGSAGSSWEGNDNSSQRILAGIVPKVSTTPPLKPDRHFHNPDQEISDFYVVVKQILMLQTFERVGREESYRIYT